MNDLFQATVPAGHIELESDVGLVGLQTFSQADRWSAVPMQIAQDASELVLPIPAAGKRFSAKIALVNLQNYEVNLSLAAFGSEVSAGAVNRLLKPHAERIASIADLSGAVPGGSVISITMDVGLFRIYGVRPATSGLAQLSGDDFSGLASFALTPAQGRESIFSPISAQGSMSLVNSENGENKTRFSMIGAGRKIVGENEITINARTSLSASLSELTKATEIGNLVLMSSAQPLTGLQIESSDQGFFIIPGQVFKSRAVYSSGQLLSRVSGGMVLSKDETISLSVPLNALKEDAAIQINGLSPVAAPPVNANRRLLAATEIRLRVWSFCFPQESKCCFSGNRSQVPRYHWNP